MELSVIRKDSQTQPHSAAHKLIQKEILDSILFLNPQNQNLWNLMKTNIHQQQRRRSPPVLNYVGSKSRVLRFPMGGLQWES